MKVRDVLLYLEEVAPPRLASDGDNIGLQVGDPDEDVSRVIVSVDPTPAVVEYAIESKAELVVTHHALIFDPIYSVTVGDPVGERVVKLISAGTALYVMHTNYDSAPGGVNDVLAERLGVVDTRLLKAQRQERLFKVAVFIPTEAVNAVRDAMAEAGAGGIGNYTHCSYRTAGIGTFLPLESAQPYIGAAGRLEEVEEYRLEMIVPEWQLSGVLDAMLDKHPYEEVAYDVYLLENEPMSYGYGRVGRLNHQMKLSEFRKRVEDALDFKQTRMIGDPDRIIETVALCSGSGRKLIPDAIRAGADVYICGDVHHPDFLDADSRGLAMIDAGHYETERPGMEVLTERLIRQFADESVVVEFMP